MLEHLLAEWGFEGLAERVPADCFKRAPTKTSALKFLRKNEWARLRVQEAYLKQIKQENTNPLLAYYRENGEWPTAGGAAKDIELVALYWLIRHHEGNESALRTAFEISDNTCVWPDTEEMPLLNAAIEHDAPLWLLRLLLEKGADPNDSRYWLPLLHAVDVEGRAYRSKTRAPRTDLIDLLLASGANAELADPRGYTALSVARAYGLKAAVNKLSSPSSSL